jgi:two-component system, cell cycle response regulator
VAMTAKILIVDDVAINTRLLTAKLKAEYYQVVTAPDGFLALEKAHSWQPDLILLDIMMPGMDGYECCRKLKSCRDTTHIPVIMLTALSEPHERIRGLEVGADDFLTKPVDYSTLMIRVKSLIRLKRLLDEWRARSDTAIALGIDVLDLNIDTDSIALGRVLIVDDNRENAQVIQQCLKCDDIQFPLTEHEIEKFLTQQGIPDLIIVSLLISGIDPLELISRVRAESRTHQTVILALFDGNVDRSSLLRAFELGASDWLESPIDGNELVVRCRNHIKRKIYQDRLQRHVDTAIEMMAVDPLTNLFNRRYLQKHLNTLYVTGSLRNMSILMVDIDHFKSINDRFGHAFGDIVIRSISSVLLDNTRAFDTVTRYGGEEFVILLPGTSVVEASVIAERLLVSVRSLEFTVALNRELGVSVSIGVSSATEETAAPEYLLNEADKALYKAKSTGRNRFELASLLSGQ